MTNSKNNEDNARRLWKKSIGGGFVVAALLMAFNGASLTSAAISGAAVAIAAGLVLTRLMGNRDGDSMAADAPPQEVDAGPETVVDAVFSDEGGDAAQEPAQEPAADTAGATVEDTAEATDGAGEAPARVSASAIIKPTKSLPGQQELAARKGTWRYQGAGA